ncbi:MAG: hypothetical protein J6V16_04025, partial [Bacteroidales bacterium]|nr:hypothetical protein [Bacteroidales bacterium]
VGQKMLKPSMKQVDILGDDMNNLLYKMGLIPILHRTLLFLIGGCLVLSSCSSPNEDYLQAAKDATGPNYNFMFAKNASWPGRIGMTLSGRRHKTCINTVTAFYNKYHTCSNCEDFIKNPEKWNFVQTSEPKIGDLIIQHDSKTGRAFHAVIIVDIKGDKYYVNHAIRTNYYKNVELKYKEHLTFYRYTPN